MTFGPMIQQTLPGKPNPNQKYMTAREMLRSLMAMVPEAQKGEQYPMQSQYPPQDPFAPQSLYPPTQGRDVVQRDFTAASEPPQMPILPPVPPSGSAMDADILFANSTANPDFGANISVPDYKSATMDAYAKENLRSEAKTRATPPALETQIQDINAQTMQAANGKAQEGATMSDLQRMAQAYFGGRTKEQKQQEMFMNIAAGLAAGKSPNFMDNLGGAVSGAINFNRDDTNRREKEALEGFIKIQGQDDTRANNQMDNEIAQENNRISWANNNVSRINATRQRANDAGELKGLQAAHRALKAEADFAQKSGVDSSPYLTKMAEISVAISKLGGIAGGAEPSAAATDAASGADKFKLVGARPKQ